MGLKLKHKLEYFEEAKEDYQSLDGSQKKLIDKALDRIKLKGTKAGKPLDGNLCGCYKMKHKKAGLRIVFRPCKDRIEIIQIIAIGKRDKKKVYKKASRRLNRRNAVRRKKHD